MLFLSLAVDDDPFGIAEPGRVHTILRIMPLEWISIPQYTSDSDL